MGLLTSDFEMKGVSYSAQYYHGERGLILLARLGKLLTPALLGLFVGGSSIKDKKKAIKDNESELLSIIVPGIAQFFMEIDPAAMPALMNDIFESTKVIVGERSEDLKVSHFDGKLGDMFLVAQKIMAWQFANFLEVLVGAIPAGPATMITSTLKARG